MNNGLDYTSVRADRCQRIFGYALLEAAKHGKESRRSARRKAWATGLTYREICADLRRPPVWPFAL